MIKKFNHGSVLVISEMFAKSFPFLLLPYITHKLGVDGYAELSLALAFSSFFLVFLFLGQDRYILKSIANGYSIKSLIKILWFLTFLVFMVFSSFSVFFGFEYVSIVIYTLSFGFLQSVLAVYQAKRMFYNYARIQFFVAVCSSFFTVIVFEFFAASATSRLLTVAVVNFIIVCFFLWRLRGVSSEGKTIDMKEYLSFSLPLIGYLLAVASKGQLEKIYFSYVSSVDFLATYSLAFQLASLLIYFYTAVNKSIVPSFYESLNLKLVSFSGVLTLISKYWLFGLIVALSIYLIPEWLYLNLFGAEFKGIRLLIFLFSFSMSLVLPYLTVLHVLLFYGETKSISLAAILSVLVYFVSIWFLFRINPLLAPLAMFFSYVYLIAHYSWLVKKVLRLS